MHPIHLTATVIVRKTTKLLIFLDFFCFTLPKLFCYITVVLLDHIISMFPHIQIWKIIYANIICVSGINKYFLVKY